MPLSLMNHEIMLSGFVAGNPVATFIIDADHHVVCWNKACVALTGIAAEQVMGTRDHWRAFYGSERPILADLILDGASEEDIRFFYRDKFKPSQLIPGACEAEDFFHDFGVNGRWLHFTAARIFDDTGQVVGAIETLQDITERRLAELSVRASEERYRQLSLTDWLTQLNNTRQFTAALEQELERASRYQRPLALLILDVDNFKQINDRWGHAEGDHVLKTLADIIRGSLRHSDSAYRYGGEEFAILMPETSASAGGMLGERLREQFAGTPITLSCGTRITASISIGATGLHPGDDTRLFFCRADGAMYQAKHAGKNRVVIGATTDRA